jgi:S1-C subfamily serine protease
MSQLQEVIARHRPGDKITVTYMRDRKTYTVRISLDSDQQGVRKV